MTRVPPSVRPQDAALTTYGARFESEDGSYVRVTTRFPEVRMSEFRNLKAYAAIRNPGRLLEVPAEGRILDSLYPDAVIVRAEFVQPRPDEHDVVWTDWSLQGIGEDQFDGVLSITPIHHADAEQQARYVAASHRVLRRNGVLVLAEPERDSAVARFLDGFVHAGGCDTVGQRAGPKEEPSRGTRTRACANGTARKANQVKGRSRVT